uniref:CSON005837 protein n=1 Tax=Culicoides sonorensis TaxID=179676 RepID=A0A336LZN2_CULSO
MAYKYIVFASVICSALAYPGHYNFGQYSGHEISSYEHQPIARISYDHGHHGYEQHHEDEHVDYYSVF